MPVLPALDEIADMIDVFRMFWFRYPRFEVSSVQTPVPPQPKIDIAMIETCDLPRNLQGKVLWEDWF